MHCAGSLDRVSVGSLVERGLGFGEVGGGVAKEVDALLERFPQTPVGVLVGSAVPGDRGCQK